MPFRSTNDDKLVEAAEKHWRARLLLRGSKTTWEKWADRNHMKFNQGKCRVMYLGQVGPMQQYKLGAAQLESSFAKKNLRVDNLDMYPQCALAAMKACCTLSSVYMSLLSRTLVWFQLG